jgi:hypothetical protein
VHANNAGQAAANAGWAQQPSARVGAVAHRPAHSVDQDTIPALGALVQHRQTVGEVSQAEDPA